MWCLVQVKAGTIFDNVLICDDEEYAEKFGEETWGQTKGPEKEMKNAVSPDSALRGRGGGGEGEQKRKDVLLIYNHTVELL